MCKRYYCDKYDHIGQVRAEDAKKEVDKINNSTFSKDEYKIIECDIFIETFFDYPSKEIKTSEGHVWIVRK